MEKKSYFEKLKDPRWQQMRLKVLERDEWMCRLCRDKDETLAVHHRYYERGKEPWDYPPEALVTLCQDCHEAERREMEEYQPLLLQQIKKVFFADDLRELAWGFSQLPPQPDSHTFAIWCSHAISSPELQQLVDKKTQEKKSRGVRYEN